MDASNGNVSVASSLNPSVYGQSVTFTATVTGDNGLAKRRNGAKPMDVTGTVSWSANTGCADSAVSGYPGVADLYNVNPGSWNRHRDCELRRGREPQRWLGFDQSGSAVGSSTTSVASSSDPSGYGQTVSFTASVTGNSPTGTVQFYVDSVLFDTETLVSGSATSASIAKLAVGTHTVTATYSGDTNNNGSTGTLGGGQVVTASNGNVAVASSGSPSTYGDSVTFTATITGDNGLAKRNGRVKPRDVTGTVAWSANTGCAGSTVSGYPGVATCTTSSLGAGTDTVTASYGGDANHNAGSGSVSQVVNQASQTITFTTPAPASAEYGSTFTVAATGGASGNAVVFTSAGACTNVGATYTMTASSGTCSVIADQAGNANYAAAPEVTETTNATSANGSVSVASSLNPSVYGQSVTFTATIQSDTSLLKGRKNGKKPMDVTGNVTWSDNTGCGTTTVTSTPNTGTGTATCTTLVLAVGSDTVTATYSGDSNHNGGSGSVSQVVDASNGNVSVASSLNPSAFGQSVTFTATVTGDNGLAKRKGAKPRDVTGTVSWSANTGCAVSTVSGYPGVATCTASSLPVGTDTVTANFSGDANHNAGSGSVSQVVNTATLNVGVASSLNPSVYGQAVSFTATVTGNSPTGTVQFNVDGSAFGSSVALSGGSAGSGSIATLAVGTHTVTAVYSGDTNNAGGTGTLAGGQIVTASNGTVAVASSANPSTYGGSVTFTATITGDNGLAKRNGGRPRDVSGTVTWSANTGCADSTVSGYPGVVTCTTSSLGAGTDTVTANYSGDANHNGGSGSVSQVVNQASQSITFTTPAPASAIYSTSFTVAATASSGLPVAFTGTGVCTNSGATYTMTSGSGTCTVIANQTGNANYAAASQVAETTNAAKASQTVTFTTPAPASAVYATSFTVAATSSVGNAITYVSSGACTNGGATYTMTIGTGSCAVVAKAAGDFNYLAAQLTEYTAAVKAGQTITFTTNAPSSAVYNSKFTVAATSSAGFSVTFSSSGACTNSGPAYTMSSGTGTCSVIADQAGNNDYAAAPPVTETTTATKASQTITFTVNAPASAAIGSNFTVAATASSGDAVTFTSAGACTNSGATYTMTAGSGTCSVIANQAGDSNYAAATQVTETVTATSGKKTPVITWATPAPVSYGIKLSTTQLNATATYNNVKVPGKFAYAPTAGKVLPAGNQTLSVTFTPTNTTTYATVTASVVLVVNPIDSAAAITATVPAAPVHGKATTIDFALTAAYLHPSGSVTVTASTGETCTGTALANGKGTCKITFATAGARTLTAAYAGNGNYNPSTSAPFSVTVK